MPVITTKKSKRRAVTTLLACNTIRHKSHQVFQVYSQKKSEEMTRKENQMAKYLAKPGLMSFSSCLFRSSLLQASCTLTVWVSEKQGEIPCFLYDMRDHTRLHCTWDYTRLQWNLSVMSTVESSQVAPEFSLHCMTTTTTTFSSHVSKNDDKRTVERNVQVKQAVNIKGRLNHIHGSKVIHEACL